MNDNKDGRIQRPETLAALLSILARKGWDNDTVCTDIKEHIQSFEVAERDLLRSIVFDDAESRQTQLTVDELTVICLVNAKKRLERVLELVSEADGIYNKTISEIEGMYFQQKISSALLNN
jgi:hypothetical protein